MQSIYCGHWVLEIQGKPSGIDGPEVFCKRGACDLVHDYKLVSGRARFEHMSV